jgi:hypothetical protein
MCMSLTGDNEQDLAELGFDISNIVRTDSAPFQWRCSDYAWATEHAMHGCEIDLRSYYPRAANAPKVIRLRLHSWVQPTYSKSGLGTGRECIGRRSLLMLDHDEDGRPFVATVAM